LRAHIERNVPMHLLPFHHLLREKIIAAANALLLLMYTII
jgi:hypothetical protein